ncbi:MAG: aminopeptidase P family protein [Candidatus Latescibacterota bacterium]
MKEETFGLLKKKVASAGVGAFISGKKANVRFVSCYSGDNGYVVLTPHGDFFLTNLLYSEHAHSTVLPLFAIHEIKDDLFKAFSELGVPFDTIKTGFEDDFFTCAFITRLMKALSIASDDLLPCAGMVEEFREVKEPEEISAIKKAQRISEKVFTEVLTLVHEGVEERELAMEIDYRFRKEGGEHSAFETIVASGPNTSKPHAVPTRRKIKRGDLVLFDMGTVVDGYASDMTRTVVLGKADRKQKERYRIVLEAQQAALEGISAGMKCCEADFLARNSIEKAGYGPEYVHSLGHGVGLEVHESPSLSRNSQLVLKKGSVVTVEPGIYFPGWGGIRIEDLVVITETGCLNLTKAPKELMEL